MQPFVFLRVLRVLRGWSDCCRLEVRLVSGDVSASYPSGHKAIPKPHKVIDFVVCMCYSMLIYGYLCCTMPGTAFANETAGHAR
jgi:hypothetical protein